jgi:hypothetical protein
MAPHRTQNLSHAGEWECGICSEEYSATSPKPWTDLKAECLVCEDCIRSEFVLALQFDQNMPAGWGDEEWEITDYAYALLDADSVLAYSITWLRKLGKFAQDASRPRDAQALASEMPSDWELGKQYQRCPVCLKPAQLLEACNHMTYPKPCRAYFCYICGEEVDKSDLDDHWAKGGCRRWNHPDDADARFDEDESDDDEDSESDSESDDDDQYDREDNSDIEFSQSVFVEYAWNTAMQNVGETTRGIMKRLLTEDFSGRVNLESLAMLSRVLTAMTRYSQSPGLDRVEWIQIVERYKTEAFLFLAKPELHGGLSPEFPSLPISHGVLNRRVGGVFDMVTPAGRAQAYSWATARGMAWRRQETQEHTTTTTLRCSIWDLGARDRSTVLR